MPKNATLKIPIVAEAMTWMAVLANVRLALRHPNNSGPCGVIGQEFADQLEDRLVQEGIYSAEEVAELKRLEDLHAN